MTNLSVEDITSSYHSPGKTVSQLLDILIPGVSKKIPKNEFHSMGFLTLNRFALKRNGLTEKQIDKIHAINDLARTKSLALNDSKVAQITSSLDAYKCLAPILMDLLHEEFWILCLNRANKVLKRINISKGGVTGTVADAKIIFREALSHSATSIILFHNHPSGTLRPSQADIDLTKNLVAAGKMIEITILDHIIIAERGYYSFADEGRI